MGRFAKVAQTAIRRVALAADTLAGGTAAVDGMTGAGGRALVPAKPIAPTMGDGNDPRAWIAGLAENINYAPRKQADKNLLPFDALRAVSDFDMVRCALEEIRGQIVGMKWGVRAREEYKGRNVDAAISAARAFVRQPYKRSRMDWRAWVSRVVEEILSTDALTLYPRRTIGGEPLGLMILDGTRIKPLCDDLGEPPLPPNPAYQQIVYGRPETQFYLYPTTADKPALWYCPLHGRVDSPYGRPPGEMVLLTANLAMRTQAYDLAYFTAGNIPEALLLVAETWRPDQIAAAQKYLDAIATGDIDRRSGNVIVAPHGQFVPTKSRDWKPEFFEALARLVCWAFNVSPLPLVRMMNRSTAETQEQSASDSGVRPVADFIAELVNRYITEELQIAEVEFYWLAEETAHDPLATAQAHAVYIQSGVLTPDEVRADIGRDPLTPEQKATIASAKPQAPQVGAPSAPHAADDGSERNAAPDAKPTPPNAADDHAHDDAKHAPPPDAVVKAELARWRKVALRLVKSGHAQRPFRSDVLPPLARGLGKALLKRAGHDSEAIRAAFRKVASAHDHQSAIVAAVKQAIETWVAKEMPALRQWAAAQVVGKAASPRRLIKAKPPTVDPSALFETFRAELRKAASAGAAVAASGAGLDFTTPPARALSWADEHAAELVGMKVTGYSADGAPILAPNPNAEWTISDALRDSVNDLVNDAIADGWGPDVLAAKLLDDFGSWRAETIARTETAMAYNAGAAAEYRDAAIDLVEILDGPGCLPDGHDDAAEPASGEIGVVEEQNEADGQVWTVDDFEAYAIGHPNCVRAGIAYVAEDGE